MDDLVCITDEDFSVDDISRRIRTRHTGAIVTFIGVVREENPEGNVTALEFETYKEMAVREMIELKRSAMEQFRLEEVAIIHRTGRIPAGEDIVLIAVAGAHRDECFMAARYLIDELKKLVPIWKKEIFEEGERWVEGEH